MDRVEFSLGSLIVNDDTSPKLSSFTHQNPLALPNHNGGSKIVWSKMTTSTLNTIKFVKLNQTDLYQFVFANR